MKAIYLTYDGLLDPLGQSQVLPYLIELSNSTESMRVISFEKNSQNNKVLDATKLMLQKHQIKWSKRKFTQSSSPFLKIFDVFKFLILFFYICIKEKPDLIHARGHPMAILASLFKIFFGFKLLFDYRGVWADERVVKGGWDLDRKLDKLSYHFFITLELYALKKADHIVVLTKKVKAVILDKTNRLEDSITVIPCACDYDLFDKKNSSFRGSPQTLTLGYLGSIGPAYRFDFYLNVLDQAIHSGIKCKGLVLTNNIDSAKKFVLSNYGDKLINNLEIFQADRNQVPSFIHQMDVLLSFYTKWKSIIGTSPVKIAEAIACGIPVIANAGIGDTDEILEDLGAGITIAGYDEAGIEQAISYLSTLHLQNFSNIRLASKKYFDLKLANELYKSSYQAIKSSN